MSDSNDQLKVISLCHYLVGGLECLCYSFPLIHLALGIGLLTHSVPMSTPDAAAGTVVGLLFTVLGGAFVLLGWTLGIMTMISGRRIADRRSRTLSIVVAAINCTFMPLGTILGVFTLILLTKPEVMAQYGQPQPSLPPPPPPPGGYQ